MALRWEGTGVDPRLLCVPADVQNAAVVADQAKNKQKQFQFLIAQTGTAPFFGGHVVGSVFGPFLFSFFFFPSSSLLYST